MNDDEDLKVKLALVLGMAVADLRVAIAIDLVRSLTGRRGGRPRETHTEPLTEVLQTGYVTGYSPAALEESTNVSAGNYIQRDAVKAIAPCDKREGGGGLGVSGSAPSVSESDRTGSLISPLRESVNVMSERRRRVRGADYSAGFLSFWAAFPRKEGKGAAWDKWTQLAPPLDAVLAALAWQRTTEQWRKDGGAFVPHPATYLNQCRWEDEKPGPAGGKPPPVPGAPPAMGEYCEFHKVVLNYRKPAFRPKATCPDCKHAAAVSRERTPTEPQGLLGIGVPK